MKTENTGRVSFIRTTLAAFCAALVVSTGSAPVASADPPSRDPNPLPTGEPFLFTDAQGNNPCGFDVFLEVTANKQTVTTFTQRSGVTTIHVTGALGVTLANEDGKSISLNI